MYNWKWKIIGSFPKQFSGATMPLCCFISIQFKPHVVTFRITLPFSVVVPNLSPWFYLIKPFDPLHQQSHPPYTFTPKWTNWGQLLPTGQLNTPVIEMFWDFILFMWAFASDPFNVSFLAGAFKTLDKDNNGTIKVNVQEVIQCFKRWHCM